MDFQAKDSEELQIDGITTIPTTLQGQDWVDFHKIQNSGYIEVCNVALLKQCLEHPDFKNFQAINLYCYDHISEAIEIFLEKVDPQQIKRIHLRNLGLDDSILKPLISHQAFSNIIEMTLSYNYDITDETIKNISEISNCKLEILLVTSTSVSDEGLKIISQSKSFTQLKALSVSNCEQVTDLGIQYLSCSQNNIELKELIIADTNITFQSIQTIFTSSRFSKLKEFHYGFINYDEIQNNFYQQLPKIFAKRLNPVHNLSLRILNANDAGIGDLEFGLICQSQIFKHLHSLELYKNQLTDKSALSLEKAIFAKTLKLIDVSWNNVGPQFMSCLIRKYARANLKNLILSNCIQIAPTNLIKNLKIPTLIELDFRNCKVDKVSLEYILGCSLENCVYLDITNIQCEGYLSFSHLRKMENQQIRSRLKILKMGGSVIKISNLKPIFQVYSFPNLQRLNITRIQDQADFQDLFGDIIFPSLQELSLKKNFMDSNSLQFLNTTKSFPYLKSLNLLKCKEDINDCFLHETLNKNTTLKHIEVVEFGNNKLLLVN